MKYKILIITPIQFGYLTDIYKYCEYSNDRFDIMVVCWDHGLPKIEVKGVEVNYISRNGNVVVRNLRLLWLFNKAVSAKYDLVFVNYFKGASLIKLLNLNQKMILDIRTLYIHERAFKRFFFDAILWIESLLYRNIAIISDGIAGKMFLKKYFLLPLGGEVFSQKEKSFEQLHFIYVGTLQYRNIIDCVKGVHKYIRENEKHNDLVFFTIIGDSPDNDLIEIKEYIKQHKLNANIFTKGRIPPNQLAEYFEEANIGVSYIPIRSYYHHQPPTKTFEYLISGLPVIATKTYANIEIVGDSGTLIDDNPDSFCTGVKEMMDRKGQFDSDVIKEKFSVYRWSVVVNKSFVPMVESVIEK